MHYFVGGGMILGIIYSFKQFDYINCTVVD